MSSTILDESLERYRRDRERPSVANHCYWLAAQSPAGGLDRAAIGYAGKWCVTRPAGEIDAAWEEVQGAVLEGRLACAKVSTAVTAPKHGHQHVICVYTSDWRDWTELMRARDVLRELGFTEELGYKRDLETVRGVYGGPDEWYVRSA